MTTLHTARRAHGSPGFAPRWTRSAKDAVGTAYSASSRLWFTVSAGVINEVYYPTIDRPQIRDLQFLVTDGSTFFHDERRHLEHETEWLDDHSLAVRVTSREREGRYRIRKEVIVDPHHPCLLVRTRFGPAAASASGLRLFAILAPRLGGGGWGNTGHAAEVDGRRILVAHRDGNWLALGATVPILRRSWGYVGASDGWTDLARHLTMEWEFDTAEQGNLAGTVELAPTAGRDFTLGLAFGDSRHAAVTALLQSLGFPFAEHRKRFKEQWKRACRSLPPLEQASGDAGSLYHVSHSLLLAHEDKTFPGAMIASLSIPWGEAKGDEELGGYHLVWTRDMVNSTTGLLASGNTGTPLRALIYLAASQQPDGGFHQNFWIDGRPHWTGVQLDEVSFPILLAWRLHEAGALRDFDPYPMVLAAAGYLVRQGPATPQERWEENAGYSPSTLASNIAALTCAACFARDRGDEDTARFLQEYADFLECHVEDWTVTTRGSLLPDIPRHFIRITPADPGDPHPAEDPNEGVVPIRNRPPGSRFEFPAREIVDAGFLELVRYGIRRAGDPLIEDSLRVVDAVLKVDTPRGPCWRRYNHDGYGERTDGGPFEGWGVGRAWPLLTGERGHYELAAGRSPVPFIRAMEAFATPTGLLPEQVWDEDDRPEKRLWSGRATGAAMPLMWAHAEYIRLLRSVADGEVFDRIPAVVERYALRRDCRPLEVWKFNRQVRAMPAGRTLRVQAPAPFRLRWTVSEWEEAEETDSRATALGIHFADLAVAPDRRGAVRFTFFWPLADRWEGRDFFVEVSESDGGGAGPDAGSAYASPKAQAPALSSSR